MNFSNKFDNFNNQNQGFGGYYNPQGYPMQMPMQYPPMNQQYNPYTNQQQSQNAEDTNDTDNSDKAILDSIEYYFSEENLNKDLYFRNRMSEEGFIDCNEIVNFNKMKNKGVDSNRIISILDEAENTLIERKEENGKVYLRNKNWVEIKPRLLAIEKIQQQKKMNK